MSFLRDAIAHTRVNYRVARVVSTVLSSSPPTQASAALSSCDGTALESLSECQQFSASHPEVILRSIAVFLSFSQGQKALRALRLLEYLVQTGNHSFHLSLSKCNSVQQRLLDLAMSRLPSSHDDVHEVHKAVQRMARLTLLEYSRLFIGDEALQKLATLAGLFESQSRKHLMRCLNVEHRHVCFTEPQQGDFVLISPRPSPTELPSSPSAGVAALPGAPYARLSDFFDAHSPLVPAPLPTSMTDPQRWECQACGEENSPMAQRCSTCETPRLTDAYRTPSTSPEEEELPLQKEDAPTASKPS